MIPPRIRLTGDKETAAQLLGQARNELSILKQNLGFQKLFQGERKLENDAGWMIHVQVIGALDVINVHVPYLPRPAEEQEVWQVRCWCTCCFAEGRVIKKFGDYGSVGWYGDPAYYPSICNGTPSSIALYQGIRYEVEVCQQDHTDRWICISSDFAEHVPGDEVIVYWHGNWKGNIQLGTGCHGCAGSGCTGACQANHPSFQNLPGGIAEGVFSILPMVVKGVNEKPDDYEVPEGIRAHESVIWTTGEGEAACIRPGTIVAIDRDKNTCQVLLDNWDTVDDVPIFYHCECYETPVHGSHAFETEEEAYAHAWEMNHRVLVVTKRNQDGEPIENLILGFEDRLPRYCFSCGTYEPSTVREGGVIEVPNNSEVGVTFQGGCPPYLWEANCIYGRTVYFETETTTERYNILHVQTYAMCWEIVPAEIRVTDANGEVLNCHVVIGCPGSAKIQTPFGSEAASGDYVLLTSGNGQRYRWRCVDGCEGGSFWEAPSNPVIDPNFICYPGVYWKTPGRTCPGEDPATIEMLCLSSEYEGDGQVMDSVTVKGVVTDLPELVYADTHVECSETVTVSLEPPIDARWVLTDWEGNSSEEYGSSVSFTAPSSNPDCVGDFTVTAFCDDEKSGTSTQIGTASFHLNCFSGTTATAYECWGNCYTEFSRIVYGKHFCYLFGTYYNYDCYGELNATPALDLTWGFFAEDLGFDDCNVTPAQAVQAAIDIGGSGIYYEELLCAEMSQPHWELVEGDYGCHQTAYGSNPGCCPDMDDVMQR